MYVNQPKEDDLIMLFFDVLSVKLFHNLPVFNGSLVHFDGSCENPKNSISIFCTYMAWANKELFCHAALFFSLVLFYSRL